MFSKILVELLPGIYVSAAAYERGVLGCVCKFLEAGCFFPVIYVGNVFEFLG
jgi:hypothetical protein